MSPGFQAGWLDDLDGAGEIDAGDHREAAHHRRLAGDGEAVLVVDAGIFDADGDVAVHQIGFVEIGQRGLGAALGLLDHDRLECRHGTPRCCARISGIHGAAKPSAQAAQTADGSSRPTGCSTIGRLMIADITPKNTDSHHTGLYEP